MKHGNAGDAEAEMKEEVMLRLYEQNHTPQNESSQEGGLNEVDALFGDDDDESDGDVDMNQGASGGVLSGLKRRLFGGVEQKPVQSSNTKRIKRSYEGVVKIGDVVSTLRGLVAAVDAVSGALSIVDLQELADNLLTV